MLLLPVLFVAYVPLCFVLSFASFVSLTTIEFICVPMCLHSPSSPACVFIFCLPLSLVRSTFYFSSVFLSCSAPSVSSQFSFCRCFLVALCFLCCCLTFVIACFLLISACLRVCIWGLFSTTHNLRPADHNNNV